MHRLPVAFWVATIALVLSGSANADSLTLTGSTSNQGTYSSAQLQNIATPSDTVTLGDLTGISLWGLLGGGDPDRGDAESQRTRYDQRFLGNYDIQSTGR